MIFFVADMFAEQYEGGAELTTEAIISSSYFPCNKILSSDPRLLNMMRSNQSAFWIFGNFSNAPDQCLFYAIKNLDYVWSLTDIFITSDVDIIESKPVDKKLIILNKVYNESFEGDLKIESLKDIETFVGLLEEEYEKK